MGCRPPRSSDEVSVPASRVSGGWRIAVPLGLARTLHLMSQHREPPPAPHYHHVTDTVLAIQERQPGVQDRIDPVRLAPDVLRAYGTSMYGAQLLEDALVNLLLAAELAAGGSTDQSTMLRESVNGWELQTLGQLLRTVEGHPRCPVEEELQSRLGQLKKRRDCLAHHFLRENLDAMIEDSRHAELVDELTASYESFLEAAEELNTLSQRLAPATSLSKQDLDEIVREVLDQLD